MIGSQPCSKLLKEAPKSCGQPGFRSRAGECEHERPGVGHLGSNSSCWVSYQGKRGPPRRLRKRSRAFAVLFQPRSCRATPGESPEAQRVCKPTESSSVMKRKRPNLQAEHLVLVLTPNVHPQSCLFTPQHPFCCVKSTGHDAFPGKLPGWHEVGL